MADLLRVEERTLFVYADQDLSWRVTWSTEDGVVPIIAASGFVKYGTMIHPFAPFVYIVAGEANLFVPKATLVDWGPPFFYSRGEWEFTVSSNSETKIVGRGPVVFKKGA